MNAVRLETILFSYQMIQNGSFLRNLMGLSVNVADRNCCVLMFDVA